MKTKFTKVQLKEWTDALRSGKYKQGIKYLNKNDKFCCLGVLCDLHKDEFHNISLSAAFPNTLNVTSYNYTNSALPNVLIDKFGISEYGQYSYHRATLAYDNDIGKSFTEIADIIEANFETID